MRALKKTVLACMLVMGFCLIGSSKVAAETWEDKLSIVDGSLLTEDSFAEDRVSILTRGNHLSDGVVQVRDEGNRVLTVAGTTSCHVVCDKVVCNLYLEQLSGGVWYTYKYWQCSTTNAYTFSPTKSVSVEGGHWYRASGGHSATKNGVYESVTTLTNGIWVS